MTTKIKNLLALVLISASFFSCSDDDANGEETIPGTKYVLGYQTDTWNANYMWSFESLDQIMTGTIDMTGQGIEQGGSYIPVANSMFACNDSDEGSVPFYVNSAGQLFPGTHVLIPSPYAYGVTDDDKVVVVAASWEGASTNNEIIVYDPATVSISSREFSDFAGGEEEGRFGWPTAVAVSGDKLFISIFTRSTAEDWDMKQDKAWIRVYEYPSLEYIKTIEDTRTTAIGMYYTNTGMIQTASGDIYSFSSNASAAGFIPVEKDSEILRIKEGETEFDANYFLNFSDVVGGKVLAAYPAGGEKAYVVYLDNADDDVEWGFLFENYKFKSAIIDLPSKTITEVTGLPAHGGDYYFGIGSLFVEDGQAYKAFKTLDEVRVYRINLSTGVATPGALVTGGGTDISSITKLTPRN